MTIKVGGETSNWFEEQRVEFSPQPRWGCGDCAMSTVPSENVIGNYNQRVNGTVSIYVKRVRRLLTLKVGTSMDLP